MGLGAEIGIYNRSLSDPTLMLNPEEYDYYLRFEYSEEIAVLNLPASKKNYRMTMSLYVQEAKNTERPQNRQNELIFSVSDTHWWITGFRPGFYAPSKMLIVVASIEFEDYNLARMFKDNLTVDNQDNFEVKIDPTGTATFTWGASQ